MQDSEVIKKIIHLVQRDIAEDVMPIKEMIGSEWTIDNKQYSIAIVEENGVRCFPAQGAADNDGYYAEGVGLSWERDAHIFKAFRDAGYKRVVRGGVSNGQL